MIAISSCPVKHEWASLSFASTLRLYPVLDQLLANVPDPWRPELRLGLQEALVNAAKHGNKLDPHKLVLVRFSQVDDDYWWVVTDQGGGFQPDLDFHCTDQCLCDGAECGRGLYILHQIFDEVRWAGCGNELHLHKRMEWRSRSPLLV